MTTTLKQHTENGYHVYMEMEHGYTYPFIIVGVCPHYGNARCGLDIKRMTYGFSDKKNANATYNRYIKKYCKNMEG